MSEEKHTPGPWFADGGKVYESQDYHEICSFWSNAFPVWEANARLIAAAPDLLEALEECVKWLETSAEGENATRMAFSAISKAKGKA